MWIFSLRSPHSYRRSGNYKTGMGLTTGGKSMEPPKSPGRFYTTAQPPPPIYSPRNMSPSPHGSPRILHSPVPLSPAAHMKSPLPSNNSNVFYSSGGAAGGEGCSPLSPRSPSPRPMRTTRFASQPTHLTSSNLATLANRRKTSLAVSRPRHVTINPTSNFLELPG